MSNRIKNFLFSIIFALTAAVPVVLPTAVAAASGASTCTSGSTSSQIASGAGGALSSDTDLCSSSSGTSGIAQIAHNVVNVFSFIVGAVSVIMIIYGGFRYVTSGGESGAVGNAKNTLVYAIVGLVIVALAQLIVHYVLSQTTGVSQ